MVVARWVGDGGGGVVAVTRAGAREAHERGTLAAVVPRSAAPRSVRHGRAVSWAAALLGLRDRAWVAERELHTAAAEWHVAVYWPSRRGTHRPDVGALVDGRRIAIEVELSAKAPRRLRAIVAGYEAAIADGQLAGVVYVCDRADVLAGVRRAAAHAGLSSQRLRTRTLADVQREVRELARARRHLMARRVLARRRVSERERPRPDRRALPVSSLER